MNPEDDKNLPQKLDPSEIQYHQQVMQVVNNAQAIQNSWMSFLAQKYNLKESDQINVTGEIVRSAPTAPVPLPTRAQA